jgi:tetratricopeptide (TPR) repeat protein
MTIAWRDVIGWNQDQIDELRAIGYSYLRQGQLKLAHTFYEALAVLEPSSLYDLRTLAGLRDLMGNSEGAIEIYNKVLAMEPGDPFSSLGLAKALLASGQQVAALERLRPLSTNPNPRIASDAQALILAYS